MAFFDVSSTGLFTLNFTTAKKIYLDAYRVFTSTTALTDSTDLSNDTFGTTWFKKNVANINTLVRDSGSTSAVAGADQDFPDPDTGTEITGSQAARIITVTDPEAFAEFQGDLYILLKVHSFNPSVTLQNNTYIYTAPTSPTSTLTITRGFSLTYTANDFYQDSSTGADLKMRTANNHVSNTFISPLQTLQPMTAGQHFSNVSSAGDVGQILFRHPAGSLQSAEYLDTLSGLTIDIQI